MFPRSFPTPSLVFLLESCQNPQPGDLIEICHTLYEHWAIYVGDGFVVHLINSVPPCSGIPWSVSACILAGSSKGVVKYEPLGDEVQNSTYRVNSYLDNKYRPWPVHEIIHLARERIDKKFHYNILCSNCEHFFLLFLLFLLESLISFISLPCFLGCFRGFLPLLQLDQNRTFFMCR
uniref:LRAT domain-containing protein n=1 Tax=Theropithecus gelada TaxID=9565 RepID=A0A8D2FAJ8_THEGE